MWIQKALALDPKDGNYHDSLAWAYYQQGKYAPALKELKVSLELLKAGQEPVDPVILDHLGEVYLKLGQPSQAESTWQQILKENPGNLDIQEKIKKLRTQPGVKQP
jgi:tetratricopeptide (TPR) repeat protein